MRSLSPGKTGRRCSSVPSRTRTGIGVMNAARRWRAIRTNLSILPGISSRVENTSRSPTQPDSGSVATTVALRGALRSKAISPTIKPGDTSATVRTPSAPVWVTSTRPDRMTKKDTARSPRRISTCPGAAVSGRSWAANGTSDSVEQPAKKSSAASSSALAVVSPATCPARSAAPSSRAPPVRCLRGVGHAGSATDSM